MKRCAGSLLLIFSMTLTVGEVSFGETSPAVSSTSDKSSKTDSQTTQDAQSNSVPRKGFSEPYYLVFLVIPFALIPPFAFLINPSVWELENG